MEGTDADKAGRWVPGGPLGPRLVPGMGGMRTTSAIDAAIATDASLACRAGGWSGWTPPRNVSMSLVTEMR